MKARILIAIIGSFGLLSSCKPRELPKEKEVVTITKTITEFKRDTLVQVKADSSFYEALIECQNGKPALSKPFRNQEKSATINSIPGKNLQPPNVDLDEDGKLKISCKYLENKLNVALREKQILQEKLSEKTITPPPEIIEKQLSWWQKTWIASGKILSSILLIFILIKIPWKALLKL